MDLTPDQVRAIVERVTAQLATQSPDLGQSPGSGRAVGRAYGSKAPSEGYRAKASGPGAAGGGAQEIGKGLRVLMSEAQVGDFGIMVIRDADDDGAG